MGMGLRRFATERTRAEKEGIESAGLGRAEAFGWRLHPMRRPVQLQRTETRLHPPTFGGMSGYIRKNC